MNLIGLLVAIAVVVGLAILAKWLVDHFELPPPLRTVALIVVGVVCLLIIVNQFGVGPRVVTW